MKSFSELLAEYMNRTGISDSELARTLGVRRQTIFRWKEGMVERPRHREDVLLCASKLRLSPEERDGLLLAAGFSPETVVPTAISELPLQTAAPVSIPEPVSPTAPPRAIPRRILTIFAIVALASLVGAIVIMRDKSPYPVAASGETLILISSFGSPVPSATATPYPRAPTQPSNIDARLQATLEREILAARLERVRVAALPQRVGDTRAAEDARQRSNAAILVWGKFEGNTLTANLTIATPASRADEIALEALVLAPTEMQLKVTPDEFQAFAWLALAQIHLDRSEYDLARASLTQAQSHPLRNSETQAALAAYHGYVNQIAKPPDPHEAILAYSQAIDLAPNAFAAYVNRGVAYVQQNNTPKWQADLDRAIVLKADDMIANRALCWAHGLGKEPARALPYCDTAVSRDMTARSREARAIAYAELGRLNEAAGDLQMFLDWLASQPASLRTRYGSSRAEWLESLKQGNSPFDDAALGRLRRE